MNARINKAIEFAARAHIGQQRKLSYAPFITHPVSVAMTLQRMGCDEDTIIAGLLHDTIEDTAITFDEVVAAFGENVAAIVAGNTEEKAKSWEQRKQATIDSLPTARKEVIQLILADKIHNLQSMYENKQERGEEVFRSFSRSKEKQHRYYICIYEEITKRQLSDTYEMLEELAILIENVFEI